MSPRVNPSVLVVDDTVEDLHLLSSVLTDHGYEVRSVSSGRLALEAALTSPPEVVLLDVSMPELDGYEACQRFKANTSLRDIPIIFVMAMSSQKIEPIGSVFWFELPA